MKIAYKSNSKLGYDMIGICNVPTDSIDDNGRFILKNGKVSDLFMPNVEFTGFMDYRGVVIGVNLTHSLNWIEPEDYVVISDDLYYSIYKEFCRIKNSENLQMATLNSLFNKKKEKENN